MALEENSFERVMGIFAHPDDPEFYCGGAFARWAAEGKHVVFVLATSGDKGTRDRTLDGPRLIEIREAEERAAAACLGVREVIFLRYPDGELQPTLGLRRDLVRQIRLFRPDVVVTNDPTVRFYGSRYLNHADHRAIGDAALDAVFPAARDHLYFPEIFRDEGLEPHVVRQVYLTGTHEPTTKIDVTPFVEIKIAALREHRSQIADLEAMAQRQREAVDAEYAPHELRYTDAFRVFNLG